MVQVLVVDDDTGTREICITALRHDAYVVAAAISGRDAIAQLSSDDLPDAMLLDLKLGDMTGYDVLRWMRAQHIAVPTAVMTAFPAEFDPDEAIELGAIAYADHPLTIEQVTAVAKNLAVPPSARDDAQRLHVRVLAGDSLALEYFEGIILETIPRRLERHFPRVPWDFAVDAAVDASLEYAAAPRRFDPTRLPSVVDFVYMIARRNLVNRLQSEFKRKQRERRYFSERPIAHSLQPEMRTSRDDVVAALMAVTWDPAERDAVRQWLDGAESDRIAAALGYANLSLQDRRREAKRFKDRLIKRLSRRIR